MPWRKIFPFSISIETAPDTTIVIVPRGTVVPFRWYTTTSEDGQTSLEMKLFKGDYPRSAQNELLATMHVAGIEAAASGKQRVEIVCDIDKDGKLLLDAKDFPFGRDLQTYVQFEPPKET